MSTRIVRYKIPSLASTWAKRFGNTGEDNATAIAIDSQGSLIVAGYFQTSIDFSAGLATPLTGSGIWNIFIVKFSVDGSFVWQKGYGASGNERVTAMRLDSSGNIFLGGNFSGTGNFGGVDWVAKGSTDAFLAKYDSNGNHLWSLAFGGVSELGGNSLNALVADSLGNVVATGHYVGTEPIIDGSRPSAGVDSFLIKYDGSGNRLWGKRFTNGGAADRGQGVAVDVSGNIFMVGFAGGSINAGGSTATLVNQGGFLFKFDSGGNALLSRPVGLASTVAFHVGVDSNGHPVVSGKFPFQTNLKNTNEADNIFGGSSEMYIVKYDKSDLSYRWHTKTTGNITEPNGMFIDSQDNVLLAGYFKGTTNFGGQSLTTAYYNGFVTKYKLGDISVASELKWALRLIGTANDNSLNAPTTNTSGVPFVAGGFPGDATFLGESLTSLGSTDIVIGRLNP